MSYPPQSKIERQACMEASMLHFLEASQYLEFWISDKRKKKKRGKK